MSDPASLPWVERYRPKTLDDLISHEDIISTINRLIDAKKLPHLLFYGPPGTGKTSTVLACARRLYGENMGRMILELNASDDRGIGVVRDQIKAFAGTKKLFSKGVKLVILDEADAMTSDAQFALRRVIEKYTKSTRFCLICNYVSKIIPALQSRCTRFRFAPLKRVQIEGRLRSIIDSEKLDVTDDGLKAVLALARGDMRRVLNILQATSMAYDTVSETTVYQTTGDPLPADCQAAVRSLLEAKFSDCYALLHDMCTTKGYALRDVLTMVSKYTTKLALRADVKAHLLEHMADIEYNLAFATSDKIQLGALVGTFIQARLLMLESSGAGAGAGARA